MKNRKNFPSPIIVVIGLYFIMSSAPQVYAWPFGKEDQEILRARAQKYWNSKLTGDMITCYQLEEPSYRNAVPISVYSRTGSLVYKEVKIKKIRIFDDNGAVEVEIHYLIPAFGNRHIFTTQLTDKWKKIDGTWFHVRKKESQNKKAEKSPKRKEVMEGR